MSADGVPRGDEFVDGVLDTAPIAAAAIPVVRDGGMIAYLRSWDGP